jgi:hypothetical protein
LVATITLIIQGRRIMRTSDRIKNIVLEKVTPILGDQVAIDQVTVGFGNIHFYGISIPLPKSSVLIEVQDLRIGYNFFRILREGFKPQFLSQDFLLVNPRFHVYLKEKAAFQSSPDTSVVPSTSGIIKIDFKQAFKLLSFIKRLSVKDGEMSLHMPDGAEYQLVHSIAGWLDIQSSDTLTLQASGNLFNSLQRNLFISGKSNLSTGVVYSLDARIKEFELLDFTSPRENPEFEFSDGVMNGNLALKSMDSAPEELEWTGHVTVSYGAGAVRDKPWVIHDTNIDLAFQNGDLIVNHAETQLKENLIICMGSVRNVFHPVFDLQIHAPALQMADLYPDNGSDNQVATGISNIRFLVSGPWPDVNVNGTLSSDECKIYNTPFKKVRVTGLYHDHTLNLANCSADIASHHVTLNNTVHLSAADHGMNGNVTIHGDLLPLLKNAAHDTVTSIPTFLEAQISGSVENPVLEGSSCVKLMAGTREMLRLQTKLDYRNRQVNVHSLEQDKNCIINGAFDFSVHPFAFQAHVEKIESVLLPLFHTPFNDYLAKNLSISVNAAGTSADFDFQTGIKFIEGGLFQSNFIDLKSNVHIEPQKLESRGTVLFYPDRPDFFKAVYSFKADPAGYTLEEFRINDTFLAHAVLKKGSDQDISAQIKFSRFQLANLWLSPDSLAKGLVDLQLSVQGTRLKPEIKCEGGIYDIFYKDYGPYQSEINCQYDESGFAIHKFLINSQTSTLISADGLYSLAKDSLSFAIKGNGFDMGAFTTPTHGRKAFLTGTGLVDLLVSGTPENPSFKGLFSLTNGSIYRFPFTELKVVLGEQKSDLKGPRINFDQVSLTRSKDFNLYGSGSFPLRMQDSLFFDLNGNGNFLVLLSDITDFFKKTGSDGSLSARITGTLQHPVLEKTDLTLDNGSIEFASVIPPVSKLKGEVVFEPEEQFVHVKSLQGLMKNRKFNIYNQLSNKELAARPIENMVLGSSGINFGVVTLETPEQGVPLNITGLMEPDNFGYLELSGRAPDEKFYFAGPSDRPLLRGTVCLHNTEVMYPFYETGEAPSELLQEFLESLEWDLSVVAGKDVRFTRTFPGAIDRAYVNLAMDEQYGGLEFSGQIRDESFRINGSVRSTTGFVEYLDINFQVDRIGVDFDRSSLIPVVYGQATTTVTDSTGMPTQIMLTLQTVDDTIDKQQVDDIVRQEQGRARFDAIRFKLSSNNPNMGTTEAEIMAALGYSTETMKNKTIDAIGYGTESYLFRPLYRPVERQIEKIFGLDYVRFSSRFAKNLLDFNLNNNLELNNRLSLLRSTKVILGKYIADRLFLQYTGQVEAGINYRFRQKGLGLHHTVGLEYHVNPQLLLELEYDYDSLMQYDREDKRVVLRHWFPF